MFWESPDIFLVPTGSGVDVDANSSEWLVTPGAIYDIYVRVNNSFGCNPVTGVKALVSLADPSALSVDWSLGAVTGGNYSVGTGQPADGISVPAGQRALLGPFVWTAPNSDAGIGNGHKCILAAIKGTGEDPVVPVGQPLPPAYNSNQVAQRNIQMSDCMFPLTNATVSNGFVKMTLSVDGATAGITGPNAIQMKFDGQNSAWYDIWNAALQQGTADGFIVTHNSGTGMTIVRLGKQSVNLPSVPLGAGLTVVAAGDISLGSEQPTTTLRLAATLVNQAGATIVPQNGGSCVYVPPYEE